MSLSPVRLRDGLLQPNRLSGGRIGGGGQSPRDAILATASPATLAYVQAVEAADGNIQLENGVLAAMVAFANYRIPLGGACCLMAGARTLAGALVPMVGTPGPTAFNFVSGDYNRKTGLVGDGSTKYLDSNRNNNADPQNSQHLAVYVTVLPTGFAARFAGDGAGSTGRTTIGHQDMPAPLNFRLRTDTLYTSSLGNISANRLIGVSRSNSSNFTERSNNQSATVTAASETPTTGAIEVFRGTAAPTNARLSYYSIGPAVDLTAMDTAITTCMSALAAAGI
jgi:hypothetical protein